MTEQECLDRLVAPGQKRPRVAWRQGVIQILVTSSCSLACVNCTQLSQLQRPRWEMTPEQFDLACRSLNGYFGVAGVFGGNPPTSKHFADYCEIIRKHVPFEQRGLWCNDPLTMDNAKLMRQTFNPAVSNLNVHGVRRAYDLFKEGWPESQPFGLDKDSRHSPCYVAMKDVDQLPVFDAKHRLIAYMENTEANRHTLISDCDINQTWSAGIGVFRGELRAWFCEIAMAQSIHHQDDPDYPDTGVKIEDHDGVVVCGFHWVNRKVSDDGAYAKETMWWELPMSRYVDQVRKHCHECGVPLRGHGALAMNHDSVEQVSATHNVNYTPKKKGRAVELVTLASELQCGKIDKVTNYLGNAVK